MLFLQPVVVNDGLAADRSAPAEVRIAERASYERMTWTGTTLAQASIGGRSPFGPNAPNANDMTPKRTLANPADLGQAPGGQAPGATATPASPSNPASPADPSSTTKIPPMRAPDSGPPPGTTTTNPDTTTDTVAPGTVAPGATPSTSTPGTAPTTATPGTTPSTAKPSTAPNTTTPGAGGAGGDLSGGMPSPKTSPTVPPASGPDPALGPGPLTLPGASSGASNTR